MELVGNTFFFDWEVSLIVWLQVEYEGRDGYVYRSHLAAFAP